MTEAPVDRPAPILPVVDVRIRFSPNNGDLQIEAPIEPLALIHLFGMAQMRLVEKMKQAQAGGVTRANGSFLRALPPVNGKE